MDGEERFLREVRETALAQGSERPGGHVPPRAAPGQRSGFRVPSLRLGVPPLPTAAQKTCMALRSSLEKIRKAHGVGGEGHPASKPPHISSPPKALLAENLSLLQKLHETLDGERPPEIPDRVRSSLSGTPELTSFFSEAHITKTYGHRNPRMRKMLDRGEPTPKTSARTQIPLETSEGRDPRDAAAVEKRRARARAYQARTDHSPQGPTTVDVSGAFDALGGFRVEAAADESDSESELSWSMCMTMAEKDAIAQKRMKEEEHRAKERTAREDARREEERLRKQKEQKAAAVLARRKALMDNPESGKWCFFNADQKKRGPYSFSELRDRVASGKLPTGVSVVRQEDGLMLPVRHGEIRREDVEFSGAFQRYCGALERAAEEIHAPEEAVNSAFGRARESSDFLRKCAPSKLAELVNWVDLAATQLHEGFQTLLKSHQRKAVGIQPPLDGAGWGEADGAAYPGEEPAPVQYTAHVLHELHKTILHSMRKRVNQEIHSAVADMFSQVAAEKTGRAHGQAPQEPRGWNPKKRAM